MWFCQHSRSSSICRSDRSPARHLQVNKYVEAEIVNHSLMRHPHIIQFKEVFLTPKFICIVMEYASGGSLFQYVHKQGRLKEAVARWFFQQLVVAVDYCHKRGVANRDIKLENTLLQVQQHCTVVVLLGLQPGLHKACSSTSSSRTSAAHHLATSTL
jgi:serine/threonine-protein kinase SRK2